MLNIELIERKRFHKTYPGFAVRKTFIRTHLVRTERVRIVLTQGVQLWPPFTIHGFFVTLLIVSH